MTRAGTALALTLASATLVAQPSPPGAAVDPSAFAYERPIPPGPAALVVLPLDAAVLAHSRGPTWQFADVRIANTSNRQIPYVLDKADDPVELALPFEAVNAPPAGLPFKTSSTYRLHLPYDGIPEASILIETSARIFSRTIALGVERLPDRTHRDRWVMNLSTLHWDGDSAVLTVPVTRPAASELLLTIDEGDNAPLPILGMRLRLPLWRVRFHRPANESLRLLYGNPAVAAPEYDIRLRRAELLREPAQEIAAGPEVVRKRTAAIVSPRLFWGVLIAAVFVLLVLVARLATSRPSEGSPPPSAPRP